MINTKKSTPRRAICTANSKAQKGDSTEFMGGWHLPHMGIEGAAPLWLSPEDIVADSHRNFFATCMASRNANGAGSQCPI